MTDKVLMTVERHRHGPTDEVVQLTPGLVNIGIAQDINGRDDMQMTIIEPNTDVRGTVVPGDYIVARDMVGYAISWGVTLTRSRRLTRGTNGTLSSQPFRASVAGWWDYIQRAMIHVLAGDHSGPYAKPIGTMFPFIEWASLFAEFAATGFGKLMGAQLAWLLPRIARIRLPPSLGGQWVGEAIPVVYDRETALKYAPRFENIEPVDSGLQQPQQLYAPVGARQTTVGNVLTNTFVPDTTLIELFPALVDGGTEPYNALATRLGKRPVLVYRMRPWRVEPLAKTTVARVAYTAEDFERTITPAGLTPPVKLDEVARVLAVRKQSIDRTRELLIKQNMFSQVTLNSADPGVVVPVPESFINQLEAQVTDADRVNATSINIPAAGVEALDTLATSALPIVLDDQVEKHGLRLYTPSWSLFGPNMDVDPEYYRTIAAQCMQFNAANHLLEKGTLELHFTRAVKVQEVPASGVTSGATTFVPALDINPGQWFRTKIGPTEEYIGYVEGLSHHIQRLPGGKMTARTSATFIRGHDVTVTSLAHSPLVPIGKGVFAAGQAGTGSSSAIKPTVSAGNGVLLRGPSSDSPPKRPATLIPRRGGVQTFVYKHLEPGFWDAAKRGGVDFIAMKLCDGGQESTISNLPQQLADTVAIQARPWFWGYHYCRTTEEAKQEATRTARLVKKYMDAGYSPQFYLLDLEGQWLGTTDGAGKLYPVTADPVGSALAFIEAFNTECPWVPVAWNGLSAEYSDFNLKRGRGPRVYAYNKRLADAIAAQGGIYFPQCYYSNRSTAKSAVNGIVKRVNKRGSSFDTNQRGALLGSQALDPNGIPAGEWFNDAGTGDCQLIADHVRYVAAFYGTRSSGPLDTQPGTQRTFGRMTGGMPAGLPLWQLIKQWKELPSIWPVSGGTQ